jgi:hypothetical protein
MTGRLIRIAVWVTAAATFATTSACRREGGRNGEARTDASAGGEPVDLYHAICDGKRLCDDFDSLHPERFFDAIVGITDCSNGVGVLFGSWQVEDADSRPFEWKADVRRGGVFPSLGHVATGLGCWFYRPQAPLASVIVALDPEGFGWVKLQGDDVFIPFHGEATIDHDFHATAKVEERGDASTLRVTVSVKGPHDERSVYRGLGAGDVFPWGLDRARVVRVVEPTDGVLGTIGWVEIDLSVADSVSRAR